MTTPAAVPLIGWCGTLANAAAMRAAGLDSIEAQLVPMKLDDDDAFADAKARVRELPLPALAMSYLFPHDVRIVGPGSDERRNRAYFDRVVELLALAKSRIVVLGQAQAEAEFLAALCWCADALQGSGTTLVIEPLNRKE